MRRQNITTGIKKKTRDISNIFFEDIEHILDNSFNYQINLFARVEEFFFAMNKFGKEEFSNYIQLQKVTTLGKLHSYNADHQKLITDMLHCLTALIIGNYSKSEILRYFFPQATIEEVGKPVRSTDEWRVTYWFKLLAHWTACLFKDKKYRIIVSLGSNSVDALSQAIDSVQYAIRKQNYTYLILCDDNFHKKIDSIMQQIFEISETSNESIQPIFYDTKCGLFKNQHNEHVVRNELTGSWHTIQLTRENTETPNDSNGSENSAENDPFKACSSNAR